MAKRETIKALMLNCTFQQWLDGKQIQCLNSSEIWVDINNPAFDGGPESYRIKPEPKYVPFGPKEVFHFMERGDNVQSVVGGQLWKITEVGLTSFTIKRSHANLDIEFTQSYPYEEALSRLLCEDGKPFGKLVEE